MWNTEYLNEDKKKWRKKSLFIWITFERKKDIPATDWMISMFLLFSELEMLHWVEVVRCQALCFVVVNSMIFKIILHAHDNFSLFTNSCRIYTVSNWFF